MLHKVCSLVHFGYFSPYAWLFSIICRRFQKHLSKYEVYKQKHSSLWCLYFTKLHFFQKVSPLAHFVYSFLIAWIFDIIHQNIQKDSSKNEVSKVLKCSQLQAKHLVISSIKEEENKDGPLLSFATKYYCLASYDLHVEAIFFAIRWGWRSQLIWYS